MPDHIGIRIAYWRHRRGGMTQTTLAGLAGLSQGYVSRVEAGLRAVERRSTLVALARALQVTVADLTDEPGDPIDPDVAAAGASIPAIRAAILEAEEGVRRKPLLSAAHLGALLDEVDEMRAASNFALMARVVAQSLAEAAAVGGIPLVRAAYQTACVLRNFGYRDLALAAARVSVAAAREAEHPAWLGMAQFSRALAMPPEAAAIASRVADLAIAELQGGAADPDVRQGLGQLHLTAALACAVDGRPDDATAHLAAAHAEALSLGDPADGLGFNGCSFGPTNVALWRMSIGVELGEFGRVVEQARGFTPEPLRVANRHQAYWLTLGLAQAHSGRTDRDALVSLIRAERAAPAAFTLHATARGTVEAMVHRARHRSVGEGLRVLARRVGVEVPR